jgi:hypothetical protein
VLFAAGVPDAVGTFATCRLLCATSAFEGNPDDICSG